MDDVRPAGPAARRTGSLLALALLAGTALSALAPAATASAAPLVEVVVTSTGAGATAAAGAVRAAGGTVRDALPLVGGVSAELPAGAVLAPAFRVVEDYPITLAGKGLGNGQAREATAVREALGLGEPDGQGAGVRVAVIDTGVAPHEDLAGRLEHHPVRAAWTTGPADPYGHGTFVAGVLAGDGSSSQGRYAGVAPGATVLDVRVADGQGETDLSSVLLGIEKARQAGADVVNLSLSSGSPLPYQLDPLAVALTALWTEGVVVVVPTGNDGPGKGSVTSPGSDPTLLTVGALDERLTPHDRSDDVVPAFSGRGPAPQDVAKPDLVAPGRSLASLRAAGSRVDAANPDAVVGARYFRGSGTSFATAAVAGTAAVMLSERDLSPDQVKAMLTGTAYAAKGLGDVRDAGAGGLDAPAALAAPAPEVTPVADGAPPAGDVEAWRGFLQALLDGDRAAAAKAWSALSPAAHTWAANSWSAHKWAAHKWGAHKWAANSWSAHKWAGADGTAEQWEARSWAASTWAAHKWASDSFVQQEWAAHTWAGDPELAAHKWAAHKWAAHKWGAHKWAAYVWS